MFKYRSGEGVYARGAAFWALTGFVILFARRLYLWLDRFDFARRALLPEIPVLGMPLTPGLLIGIGVALFGMWGAWKAVNAGKLGDLLIDTELEMKKVTWPTFEETRKAAFVVIVCVLVMVAFLTAADKGLTWLFFDFVYGGSGHGG